MKKTVIVLGIIATIVVAVIVAWKMVYPTNTLRYKVTVEVETPEGLKVGSAVREVTVMQQPELPDSGPNITQKGEAVVIDLGKRGVAFAVMGADDYWTFFDSFAPQGGAGSATEAEGMLYYEEVEGQKSLELKNRPLVVMFKDINDPKSVEAVYRVTGKPIPSSPDYTYKVEDNFERLFGSGVLLKNMIIETTSEPVTWEIEKYLTWLPSRKNIPGPLAGSPEKPYEDPSGLFLTGVELSKGRLW